ncbi:MAG: hypothetical protein DRN37_03440 [Thermoplasmata archaeon]|nr:MAG: hypothetical protein DRN37_03440 [Thermoplasmata archaeon]
MGSRLSRTRYPFLLLLSALLVVPVFAPGTGGEIVTGGEMDPGGAYVAEKQGFRYLQVRGTPDEIGYQHGSALHDLIPRSLSAYSHATERSYNLDWSQVRRQGRTYWRYVPDEQKREIEGIARGASERGALNPLGNPVDEWDILALNAIWDIWWRAEPPGNIWWWLPNNPELPTIASDPPHHCSAFVATGNATKDGGFVLGQSLWMPYFLSPAHAVYIDIIPEKGNRILMEVTAGMIWSGTEYYINSAGLVVAETTLGTGPYRWLGVPSFVRLRKAVQYASSIDEFKDIMLENTNGAYCGDYLLADTKTNEVAVLELGSYEWELKRTMDGFLPSCNYPWDPEVAEEMGAARGWDHGCYPRWVRWEQLAERDYGNITVCSGMEYLGDHYDTVENRINPCSHTLCGHVENASGYPHGSIDGKVTNRTMALRMELWSRFGHSCGQPFLVDEHRKEHPEYAFDDLVDIIPRPYAAFSPFTSLDILVLDRNGEPVAGALVNITSNVDNSSYELVTDGSGTALFGFLPCSDYSLNVRKGNLEGRDRFIQKEDSSREIVVRDTGREGGISRTASIAVAAVLVIVGLIAGMVLWRKSNKSK